MRKKTPRKRPRPPAVKPKSARSGSPKIHLRDDGFLSPEERAGLKRLAARVVREERHPATELSLWLTTDEKISTLNKRFLKRDGPTDVISFPDGEPHPDGTLPLGDIAVSGETARRNARRYKHAFFDELRRLVIHGVLHLLGHGHKKDAEMRRLEKLYAKMKV
ncbi:MAG: rRNA maturation RNase YbeY [Acidobacteriota bacterium]|nr:MAG: rRNA maturation RNase YbeY [Acidobacteriota bacterium]